MSKEYLFSLTYYVPECMKMVNNWVLWKTQQRDGRITKLPYQVNGKMASTTDPATWADYQTAIKALNDSNGYYQGIGFVFTEKTPCFIDLDHVLDPNAHTLNDEAYQIVQSFKDTYIEVSQSGEGLHIFAFGDIPKAIRYEPVEMYHAGRFCAMTCKAIQPVEPKDMPEQVAALYKSMEEKKNARNTQKKSPAEGSLAVPAVNVPSVKRSISADEVIERISKKPNIYSLFTGNWQDKYQSQSDGDLALCSHLAFYCDKNAEVMDEVFRLSGLMRDKWDRKTNDTTYGRMTIQKAIEGTDNTLSDFIAENKSITQDTAVASQEMQSVYDVQTQSKQDEPLTYRQQIMKKYSALSYAGYMEQYSGKQWAGSLYERKTIDPIPTGFKKLDDGLSGGLYPGLYVIGALPSLGKTTFTMQIMDQLAMAGKNVLIFSLEMSKDQLISKSISRETHEVIEREKLGISYAMSSTQVLRYKPADSTKAEEVTQRHVMDTAKARYIEYAQNVFIYQDYFSVNAETIREHVELHSIMTGHTPVVVVDYLQIMACDDPQKRTDKERADHNISKLKRLANEYNTTVFVVASINRESYNKAISLSSFKESGGIEYGSDVVLGLEFRGMNAQSNVKEEMEKSVRSIQCTILKNRFGAVGNDCYFNFYPKYNRYKETE